MSTIGVDFLAAADSGVLHALLSFCADQGSNAAGLFWGTIGEGFDAADVGLPVAERLTAEGILPVRTGEEAFVGGGTGGRAGDANAKPAKSSSAKPWFDRTGRAAVFAAGATFWVKEKSRPPEEVRPAAANGFV